MCFLNSLYLAFMTALASHTGITHTQQKRIRFQQNIPTMLYLHEGSPGTWGTNPLTVLSCVLGSCTLGTTCEKVQRLNTNNQTKKRVICDRYGLRCDLVQGCALHVSTETGLLSVPHWASG